MSNSKTLKRQANQKGNRLNWTPVSKAEKVSLKKLDVRGKKVSSDIIQKAKKFVDGNKHLLVP